MIISIAPKTPNIICLLNDDSKGISRPNAFRPPPTNAAIRHTRPVVKKIFVTLIQIN
jgi:hypothetical protein